MKTLMWSCAAAALCAAGAAAVGAATAADSVAELAAAAAPSWISIEPESGKYVDEGGRLRVFHGLNAVFKLSPWHPQLSGFDPHLSLSEIDAANLRSWGFNMLRVGVMWEGFESSNAVPGRATFNTSYLQVMDDLATMLGNYGIYSIFDMHEDSLSRKFCGEGIPDPYIHTNVSSPIFDFPFPLPWKIPDGPDGYPNLTICQETNFALYLMTVEEGSAWENLYHGNSSAAMANFWLNVAKTSRSNPAVLGFELFNEPWPGDVWTNPLDALIPGRADTRNILPMYQPVYNAIRTVDTRHIVFYEPVVTAVYFGAETGFPQYGPGAGTNDTQTAFAYHLYCVNQNSTGDITNVTACGNTLDFYWQLEKTNKAKVRGGSFLTEYGAVGPHQSSAEAILLLGDLAETTQESLSYWSFKAMDDITTQNPATETLYNADGSLQLLKLAALSRTYAPAVAGVLDTVASTYNGSAATKDYQLTYTVNPAATPGLTEVYFNRELNYPTDVCFGLLTSPPTGVASVVTATGDANRVWIQHDAAVPAGATVQFWLRGAKDCTQPPA